MIWMKATISQEWTWMWTGWSILRGTDELAFEVHSAEMTAKASAASVGKTSTTVPADVQRPKDPRMAAISDIFSRI